MKIDRRVPQVLAVVGAQYGSEGKGAVIKQIADWFPVHVRTGGPNAGHSLFHAGRVWKMRSVPCGWVNASATLVIGAGAIVNPEVLRAEIDEIKTHDPGVEDRIYIDARAWCVVPADIEVETDIGLRSSIGSTLEGVGSARVRRILRKEDTSMWALADHHRLAHMVIRDTGSLLQKWRQSGVRVLLEGTQGIGLSLTHGEWPFVTSHDTSPAQLAADAGIPCRGIETLLVFRTYPIRVAGNSGPLLGEITWEQLSQTLGRTLQERTTVTGRVRRVGMFNQAALDRARRLTGARYGAMTFADYLDPSVEGATRVWPALKDSGPVKKFLQTVERRNFEIVMVGTGGPEFNFINRVPRSTWLGSLNTGAIES
jgi:adenylosuccinate synthase